MSAGPLRRLVIATRASRLALWQAEHVMALLEAGHPGLGVEILALSTRGDELLEARLDKVGGKGLFVKELETGLLDRRADIAVHSMKDVPADLPDGFTIAAITVREDPRDAFVSNAFPDLASMPAGATVGTSSLRRASQVLARHPRLDIRLLRGNVVTRVEKLDRGQYDAVVLAAAGLKRLGLGSRIRRFLDLEESVPAAGQGALGIECLDSRHDVAELVGSLADRETSQCVRAERAVSRALGGSCTIPLGAHATCERGMLRLRAIVASADGQRLARAEARGPAEDPEALGSSVASALRAQGADAILGTSGS